jgi:mannose-6-phosphate isomerase-like protein (cupin superfamily)
MKYRMGMIVRDLVGLILLVNATTPGPLSAQTIPQPCVIKLSDTTTHHQAILTGPPQTTNMESGLVVLMPGKSGTQHSSKGYEEALVVIAGEGEMVISGGPILKLVSNSVAYCPTQTTHYIKNSGMVPLRYVYVAARVIK